MTVSTVGAEWKRFYADPVAWPEGAYHDDTVVRVDGKHDADADLGKVPDHAKIEIETGIVVFPSGTDVDLVAHFTQWHAAQTFSMGVFKAPKDKIAAIQAAIIAAGGTLVS